MGFLRNAGLVGLLSLSSCLNVSSAKEVSVQNYSDLAEKFVGDKGIESRKGKLEEWVRGNLDRVMKEQERNLGIKHFGKPDVFIGLPAGSRILMNGRYIYEEIEEAPGRSSVKRGIYLDTNFFSEDDKGMVEMDTSFLERVLSHELAHYYNAKLVEALGLKPIETPREPLEVLGLSLVIEGIGKYFELYVGKLNDRDSFNDSKWPDSVFLLRYHFYDGGHCLVEPILNEFGVEKGVAYLTKNPPKTREELLHLPEYRERITKELRAGLDLQVAE